jgi:hypothetical protein
MEQMWTFAGSAVTVTVVDFLDPAVADEPHARERGVRLEVRPVRWRRAGSIYASPALDLGPAVVRVDLLESAPHAADRMHWHPDMRDGEPGDRTFDRSLGEDPRRWLEGFLGRLPDAVVDGLEPELAASLRADEPAIAAAAGDILDRVMQELLEAREPWPEVAHDERGLAHP